DGNLDIAASDGFILLGDGHGGFELRELEGPFPRRDLVVGDFNNDGNLDLAGNSSESFVILLGDGQGGFPEWRNINLGLAGGRPLPADFNHDGNLDVATVGGCLSRGNAVGIFLGDGEANLREAGVFGFGCECGGGIPSLVAGDFNEDGLPDL